MRRTKFVTLALSVLVIAVPVTASAGYGPPPANLRSGGKHLQKGNLGSYCWSFDGGSGCGDASGYDFPGAAHVPAGATVRIRLRYPEKPDSFKLVRWHEVDDEGQPVGDGKKMRRDLRKVRRNGEVVAWDAVFHVHKPDHHYYLDAFGTWSKGDASYSFHVKTKEE